MPDPDLTAASPPAPQDQQDLPPSLADYIWEIIQTFVIAGLLIVCFRAFVFQNYIVEGQSMLNTLLPDERVIVSRIGYLLGNAHRGDIIVFQYPYEVDKDYVKRVIGLPGETIAIANGHVTIDGKPLPPETYIDFPNDTTLPPTQLADDEYWVMGDNRAGSSDSRSWGPLKKHFIIGKAWLIYYPFARFDLIPHVDIEPVS